ncbi:hypothetical protein ACJIZ3_025256 [Penstemon smallii]|uniref:U1-type domain-containing protein n=1 Tax=Penstemon smallii TaxID=265156 RepID=A0ABD3TUG1_9LAMI
MESRHTRIEQQAALPHIHHPSNYNYFTEQARRAGYMRPEIGPTIHEHFQDHHHHIHSHRPPFPFPQPQPQPQPHPHHPPHPHYHPYPHDMHEAIQREIEKERIREEIIMAEIARRRVLEAEVRRELMMERELALRRGSEGFPFGSSPVMGLETRLPLLGTGTDGSSLEERIALSTIEERERLNGRHESRGFETLPFQRGAADLRISEVKSIFEGDKEKEKIILLAKPDVNISGSKRKATPPGADASELSSDAILEKKAKEEWSCALCHVSANSEHGLNEHLQGKKHKSKEAALRAQRTGKNYSIGLFPKKATQSIRGTEGGVKVEAVSLPFKKADDQKPNSEVVENVEKKKKMSKFWCEMCKVRAFTKKGMDGHKRGKKHLRRLQQSNQNEKIAVVVNHAEEEVVEGEKDETSGNIEEVLSEDLEPFKPEHSEPVNETNAEEVCGAMEEDEQV